MAHFYAEMRGRGVTVHRCGTSSSGLWAHLRGWRVGVEVHVDVNDAGEDEVTVFKTSGSKNKRSYILLGSWTEKGMSSDPDEQPRILSRLLPVLGPRVVEAV